VSQPPGPTGVITLKKIGDMTYEQYGAIVLSTTGVTQVTMSAAVADQLFQPNIEEQITWIEEFGSRIQGDPHQDSQSSLHNASLGAWPGGAWATQGSTRVTMVPQATLSGTVRQFLQTISVALPDSVLADTEAAGTQQRLSETNRNPTYSMRWAQTATDSVGSFGIGWHRTGESFTNLSLTINGLNSGVYFRHEMNEDILGACRTFTPFIAGTQTETTLSMGVSASAGVFHAGRIVITGGGTAAEFFMDGVSRGVITTDIPTIPGDPLTPGFSNSNANVPVCDVDYMAMSQRRTPV